MSGTSWVPTFVGYSGLVRIGRGGFSEVYRAHQDRLDRDVAIKVLSTDLSDPADVRRFETECRVLGRLGRHPHIVDVYDAGVSDDGRAFIVMKLYEGGTLAQRVLRDGPLPVADVIALGRQIAEALAAAHAEGVVHRDIKPENVLLDERGEPVVSDFGVAAVADPDGRYTSSVAFSRAYVAPEVLDRNEYGVASDIYSYGATLYTLLTGRPVFQATTEARTVLAVLQDDPEPIGRDDVPAGLDTLVMSCLAKTPDDRPADASTVKTALDALATALAEPSVTEIAPAVAAAVVPTLSEAKATPVAEVAYGTDEDVADSADDEDAAQPGSADDGQLTVLRPLPEPVETSAAPAAATVAPSKSLLPPPAVPRTKAPPATPAAARRTKAQGRSTSSRRTWLVPVAGIAASLVLVAGVVLATRSGSAAEDLAVQSPAPVSTTARSMPSSSPTPSSSASATPATVAPATWSTRQATGVRVVPSKNGPALTWNGGAKGVKALVEYAVSSCLAACDRSKWSSVQEKNTVLRRVVARGNRWLIRPALGPDVTLGVVVTEYRGRKPPSSRSSYETIAYDGEQISASGRLARAPKLLDLRISTDAVNRPGDVFVAPVQVALGSGELLGWTACGRAKPKGDCTVWWSYAKGRDEVLSDGRLYVRGHYTDAKIPKALCVRVWVEKGGIRLSEIASRCLKTLQPTSKYE